MSVYKGVTTLIFDLGGVLVNLDWKHCVDNFKKIGISEMDTLISTTLQKGFILQYERGEISTEEFRAEVKKHTNADISDYEIDFAWISLLVDVPEEKLQLLLELKKKYRILMLSNTNELSYDYCKEHFFSQNGHQISDYFDRCYLSYKMGMNKPDSEIFLKLLEAENLKPEECLFLDDGIKNVNAAKELNFNVEYIEPYTNVSEWEFLKGL